VRTRLRVLQVMGSSAGGVARHVAQIAAALAEPSPRGLLADVVVAGPEEISADVARFGSRVRFHAVSIADRPRAADAQAVRRLRALARRADVVHAHGLRAGALAVMAARLLPSAGRPRVVVTLHNMAVGGRGVRAVSAVLERVVARGADMVLGVSGDLVERAALRGARATERALVPAPPVPRAATTPAEVRAELGVPAATALLVTVARLAPQKGLETLADAAALLRTGGDVVWVVAGDGPLREHLAARVRTEGLPVQLLGHRQDVPALLAAADVVVSTAIWEGQPLAVQEALQLGAAVVATDAGGTRDVTGDAALLVPVGDAQAVAAAVRWVLADDNLRRRLGASALARAADLPDVGEVVAQLARVYDAR
jgi:glycosyltransferase involved in cell wall biosynthesis